MAWCFLFWRPSCIYLESDLFGSSSAASNFFGNSSTRCQIELLSHPNSLIWSRIYLVAPQLHQTSLKIEPPGQLLSFIESLWRFIRRVGSIRKPLNCIELVWKLSLRRVSLEAHRLCWIYLEAPQLHGTCSRLSASSSRLEAHRLWWRYSEDPQLYRISLEAPQLHRVPSEAHQLRWKRF